MKDIQGAVRLGNHRIFLSAPNQPVSPRVEWQGQADAGQDLLIPELPDLHS